MTTKVSLANFDDTLFSLTQGQIPDAPRITNVIVANVNYAATGGTTLSSNTGGFLRILGSNFITGCQVLVRRGALKSATTVTRIDSTELRAVMPTSNVGLNILFVTNPDGASGLSSITYV